MHYNKIIKEDLVNGPGLRTTLFVQGCTHHCKNCFNPETWDFDGGYEFTNEKKEEFLQIATKEYINGISLLGGDPLCIKGNEMEELLKEYKNRRPDGTVWLWTGYTINDILGFKYVEDETYDRIMGILKYVNILVDGPFIEDLKHADLQYRGSLNQHVIDMQSLINGEKLEECCLFKYMKK